MSVMIIFVYAVMFVSGVGAGVYLVMNGHPWFALLVFLMTGCLEVKAHKPNGELKAEENE